MTGEILQIERDLAKAQLTTANAENAELTERCAGNVAEITKAHGEVTRLREACKLLLGVVKNPGLAGWDTKNKAIKLGDKALATPEEEVVGLTAHEQIDVLEHHSDEDHQLYLCSCGKTVDSEDWEEHCKPPSYNGSDEVKCFNNVYHGTGSLRGMLCPTCGEVVE